MQDNSQVFESRNSYILCLEHMYKCTFFVESVVLSLHLCRAPGCGLWSFLLMGLTKVMVKGRFK